MIKKLHNALFTYDDILFFDEYCCNITFSNHKMGILSVDLSNTNFLRGFQPPPFKVSTPYPACPLFKIVVFPPLFSVPPSFKVFQTVPPTLRRPPPALIRPVAFYQKSMFIF